MMTNNEATRQDMVGRRSDLQACKTNEISPQAFVAIQARIDLINKAIAALDRLADAQQIADVAVREAASFG